MLVLQLCPGARLQERSAQLEWNAVTAALSSALSATSGGEETGSSLVDSGALAAPSTGSSGTVHR